MDRLVDRRLPPRRRNLTLPTTPPSARLAWLTAFALGGLAVLGLTRLDDPADAFAPLPLAVVAILIGWLAALYRARRLSIDPTASSHASRITHHASPTHHASLTHPSSAVGLSIFSLALLAKISLNARIYHYGFVLAMPATLLVVAAVVGWVPAWVSRRGRDGATFRAGGAGALAAVIGVYLSLAARLMQRQAYPVGEGGNRFRADERGAAMDQILHALRRRARPGDTLAVLPEGAMLNVLAGRTNPTPYWSANPPFSFYAPGRGEAAGERKVLESLEARPPDWVVLVDENLSEFGTPYFGRDYAKGVCASSCGSGTDWKRR